MIAAPSLVFLLCICLLFKCTVGSVDPGFVVSLGEPSTFDILHENERVVAVISLLPPITLGENASR